MKRLKRIFFPKWVAWFVLLVIVPVFLVLEYEAFYGKEQYPLMGAVFGFILVLTVAMAFLVSYGKVPYMLIEG
jgi:hypothetical protein